MARRCSRSSIRPSFLVVHPTNSAQLTPQVVAKLQGAGVKVIAYISIGEDSAPHDAAGNPIPNPGNGQGPVRYTGTASGYDASQVLPGNAGVASFYVDQRNRMERLFNRLKQFRRVATRYEKRAANYLVMVTFASILSYVFLNRVKSVNGYIRSSF